MKTFSVVPALVLTGWNAAAAWAQAGETSSKRGVTPPAAPKFRVACVGDSITFGSGTSNARLESYPAQLGRMLGPDYEVRNFGVGGTTLLKSGDKPYWREKAYAAAVAYKADIVVILLGTNDSKPQNWKFKDEFIANYESLVESFTAAEPKPKVYIGYPIVVVGQGNFGINEAGVDDEMPMIDRIARDEKATVIDLHATLLSYQETIKDRVHPNDQGAGLMAKTVCQAISGQDYTGAIPASLPDANKNPSTPATGTTPP